MTIDAGRTWKKIEGGGLPAYGQWGRVGLAFARPGEAFQRARDALVVVQPPAGQVGHRGVRKDQLPGGKA